MTVRELLKEILVSGCSLDDQLCLVTKFSQPDHVDLTREEGRTEATREEGRTVIMEFGDDK